MSFIMKTYDEITFYLLQNALTYATSYTENVRVSWCSQKQGACNAAWIKNWIDIENIQHVQWGWLGVHKTKVLETPLSENQIMHCMALLQNSQFGLHAAVWLLYIHMLCKLHWHAVSNDVLWLIHRLCLKHSVVAHTVAWSRFTMEAICIPTLVNALKHWCWCWTDHILPESRRIFSARSYQEWITAPKETPTWCAYSN